MTSYFIQHVMPLIIVIWGYVTLSMALTYWATPDMALSDMRNWITKTTPLLLALLIGIGGCFFIFHEHLNPLIYLMVLFNIGLFLTITFIEIGFFRVLKKVFDNWVIFVFMLLFMFVFNYWLESKEILAEITKMWHVNASGQSQHNGPFIRLFRFIIEDITFLLFAFWVFFYNTFPWSTMRFPHPVGWLPPRLGQQMAKDFTNIFRQSLQWILWILLFIGTFLTIYVEPSFHLDHYYLWFMGFWFVFLLGWIGWGFRIPYALNLVFPAVRGWAALWIVLVQDFFKFLIILVFAWLLENFLVHTLRPFLESLEKKHDLAKSQVKAPPIDKAPPVAAAPMVAEAATAVVVEKVLSDGDKNMLKMGDDVIKKGIILLTFIRKISQNLFKEGQDFITVGKKLVETGAKTLLKGGEEALKWGEDAAKWGLKASELAGKTAVKGIKGMAAWAESASGWGKKASASGEAASKDQTKEYS